MTDPTALPNLPGFGAAPAGGQPEEAPAPLRDRVLEAVTALGLQPEVDQDGDIAFTVQDQQMFVRPSDDDAEIVRVFGQWRLSEPVPEGRLERLEVCNEVNAAFNCIKTALADDTLLVTSEHMLPRGADLQSLFQVAIPLVMHAVGLWHQRAMGDEAFAAMQSAADAQTQGQPGPAAPEPGASFGLNGAER